MATEGILDHCAVGSRGIVGVELHVGDHNLLQAVKLWVTGSVTRLGNILNFGQLFKAFGNN